ncbi:hypothetical protein CAC42_1447 [Sphaceloma murrayae]|uniref:Uncharacterized protein n=1 Tax=Sphaceloma murrayae TaxID=2082308 RepID=A0A2K1QFN4_9PEZI|nr:hypothetical protein CAC42_1447 [Sphaceloma murrayae]
MDQQTPTSPGPRRPRTGSRSYSLKSDKSNGPQSPQERAEKERRDSFLRGESKANPNAALQESQPSSRNVMEKTTLDSIRGIQVKDAQGNPITEPDLSNPTRPRWERPLDTIRSFEKAIDGDYSRRSHQRSRKKIHKPDRSIRLTCAESEYDQHNKYASRRSSYMASQGGGRYNTGSSYYNSRPESQYDVYGAPPPAPRTRFGRGMSEGAMGRGGHIHHPPPQSQYGHHNGSYETNGSDSTGPWIQSTDPSSQNSSFERLHGASQGQKQGQSPEHGYGMNDGYGQNTIQEETDAYGMPPQPPPKAGPSGQRQPIKLGGSGEGGIPYQGGSLPPTTRPAEAKEKRQSWLGRRFSKNK